MTMSKAEHIEVLKAELLADRKKTRGYVIALLDGEFINLELAADVIALWTRRNNEGQNDLNNLLMKQDDLI